MSKQVVVGTRLTVLSLGDVLIQRRLVSVENSVYFVCKDEEFEAAKSENREPVCSGFRSEYVLESKSARSGDWPA